MRGRGKGVDGERYLACKSCMENLHAKYIYIYMYLLYIFIYALLGPLTHIYVRIYIYVHMSVYIHTCTYTYVCIHVYVYIPEVRASVFDPQAPM